MPRTQSRGYNRSTRYNIQGTINANNPNGRSNNFGVTNTGIWRHDTTNNHALSGTPIGINFYTIIPVCKTARTFTGAADAPPTASDSNNYPTPFVFNGSRISNVKGTIKIENDSASQSVYLDVYEIAVSFLDADQWETQYAGMNPLLQNVTAASINAGDISERTPDATIITDQQYRSFKGVQHFMKKIGTLQIGNNDSSNNTIEFNFQGLPSKCRRSQTGMWYGFCLHNNSITNSGRTALLNINSQISFDEHPSDNRLPYQL